MDIVRNLPRLATAVSPRPSRRGRTPKRGKGWRTSVGQGLSINYLNSVVQFSHRFHMVQLVFCGPDQKPAPHRRIISSAEGQLLGMASKLLAMASHLPPARDGLLGNPNPWCGSLSSRSEEALGHEIANACRLSPLDSRALDGVCHPGRGGNQ